MKTLAQDSILSSPLHMYALHVPDVRRWYVQTMSDSLMYRLSYYRFADEAARQTGRRGFDRVRNCEIGLMDFKYALCPD